ncbi:MAG: ATP-binding protein [Bacteroidota bacterium]
MPSSFKRKLCLYLLLLCNSYFLPAQDSLNVEREKALLAELKITDSDNERLELYKHLVQLYRYQDAQLTLSYSERGIEVAKRLKDKHAAAHFYWLKGSGHARKRELKEALISYEASLRSNRGNWDTTYAFALNGLGTTYEAMDDHISARRVYNRVIELGDSLKNPFISTIGLGNLSNCYIEDGFATKAKAYLLKAKHLAHQHDLIKIKAFAYSDLALVYSQEHNYDSADFYIELAILTSDKNNSFPYIAAMAYLRSAQIHFEMDRFNKCLRMANKAINLSEKSHSHFTLAEASLIKLKTYKTLDDQNKALEWGYQIQELAKEAQISTIELQALDLMADIYYSQGDYKRAYKYQKLCKNRIDENYENKQSRLQELAEIREKLAEKEKDNRKLNKEIDQGKTLIANNKMFALGMVLFAFILLLVLLSLYGQKYSKDSTQILTFSKLEKIQVAAYKKQLLNLVFVFYPPIIIHQFIWAGYVPAMMQGSLFLAIVLGRIFMEYGVHVRFYWLTLCFYLTTALLPLYQGPIDTAFAAIVAIFLNAYYQAENRFERVLNYILFPLSYATYSFLAHVQPYSLSGDQFGYSFLVGFVSISAIFIVIVYINQGTLDFKHALWKSNEFLRQVTDLNPHHIFAKDSEGKFTLVNKAMAQNLGRSAEEFIGKDETSLGLSKEHANGVADDLSVISEGRTINRPEEKVKNRGMERYFHTIKKPIYNENWEITGMLGVATEITDLKLAQQQRVTREATLNAIISSIPDPIIVVDAKMNPIILNKEFYHLTDISSISYKEGIIDYLKRTLPDIYGEKYQEVIQAALLGKSYTGFEKVNFQGLERHYEISGTPVRDKQNNIIGAILLGLNVTEKNRQRQLINKQIKDLNQKNEELEKYIESNMSLEHFAYLASHDLKAPLRTIISFSQLFEKRVKKKLNKDEKELLSFVIGASKNMERLITDLLDYSRVNTRKLDPSSIQLKALVKEVLNELSLSVKEKKAQFQLRALPDSIRADRTKFRRLLQNLITNSLKFSKPDKEARITISATEDEHYWTFMVKDNGIGIAEKYQAKIFLLFQRLHGDAEYEGTGIGLAMVKKIVEQHGGKIWLESEVGKGSRFYFSISKSI